MGATLAFCENIELSGRLTVICEHFQSRAPLLFVTTSTSKNVSVQEVLIILFTDCYIRIDHLY